ncbi:outer membrane protein transport protein [Desulfococcaceae bacterium HSG9]|nr:outer membrane protein transport protein [Desulfococcaceae bacterium HSG9]
MIKKTVKYAGSVFIGFLSMLTISAYADEFHFNSLQTGDRAAAMGGAYTALSNDASGLYYNPAGIAFAETGVSAIVNAYVSSETRYGNVLANTEFKRTSSEIVPGMLGGVYHLPNGNGTVGFSIVIPNSEMVEQDEKNYKMTVNGETWWHEAILHYRNDYRVYNIGFSYGYPVSDAFSIGTSVYGHWRGKEEILNQKYRLDHADGSYEWHLKDINIDETEWGVLPVLGLIWKPNEKYSLGLSLSRIFVLSEEYLIDYSSAVVYMGSTENPSGFYSAQGTTDVKREYPWVIKAGVAYAFSPALLFSWDLAFHTATDRQDNEPIPSTFATKSFFNTALGTEYHISDTWILNAGFFTNLANTDMDDLQPNEHREAIDMYGGTLGLTYKKGEYLISIGTSYSAGTGKAIVGDLGYGEKQFSGEPVDAESSLWSIFLSLSK